MAVLNVRPIYKDEANDFVDSFHRHNERCDNASFAVSLREADGTVVGVAVLGRPASPQVDDGVTLEIKRVCIKEGIKNGNSMLYGASQRIAKALGYRRVLTYTLLEESGVSLRASGFIITYTSPEDYRMNEALRWPDRKHRPRKKAYPEGRKVRWEVRFDALPLPPSIAALSRSRAPPSDTADTTAHQAEKHVELVTGASIGAADLNGLQIEHQELKHRIQDLNDQLQNARAALDEMPRRENREPL